MNSALYGAGPTQQQLEQREVAQMEKTGVAEPTVTEQALLIVLLTRRDGNLRFCVHYRRLNTDTVRDSYPIPRMDECIDSLGEAKLSSTLAAYLGPQQVKMEENDVNKTEYVPHYELYKYTRMLHGLINAPATCQRAMNVVLAIVERQYALVYIDDIIIFQKAAKGQ